MDRLHWLDSKKRNGRGVALGVRAERTGFHDQEGYWRAYSDDDVFYGHVLGCKGLERRAVVLCLNEDGSRAAAELVVGEPETVRRVGGPDVAKRVGIG